MTSPGRSGARGADDPTLDKRMNEDGAGKNRGMSVTALAADGNVIGTGGIGPAVDADSKAMNLMISAAGRKHSVEVGKTAIMVWADSEVTEHVDPDLGCFPALAAGLENVSSADRTPVQPSLGPDEGGLEVQKLTASVCWMLVFQEVTSLLSSLPKGHGGRGRRTADEDRLTDRHVSFTPAEWRFLGDELGGPGFLRAFVRGLMQQHPAVARARLELAEAEVARARAALLEGNEAEAPSLRDLRLRACFEVVRSKGFGNPKDPRFRDQMNSPAVRKVCEAHGCQPTDVIAFALARFQHEEGNATRRRRA